MDVNSDKGFELDSLDFGQICGGDCDKRVQNVKKALVGRLHNFLVRFGQVESVL